MYMMRMRVRMCACARTRCCDLQLSVNFVYNGQKLNLLEIFSQLLQMHVH